MRTDWILVLSLVFIVGTAQAEDGGVLAFNSRVIPDSSPAPWPINTDLPSNTRAASMQLGGLMPEQVISGTCDGRLMAITANPPYRLFLDQNGDQKCQSEEIHSTSEPITLTKYFKGVPYLAHIGEMTQSLVTDIQVFSYSISAYFSIRKVQSGYQGKVSIGGSEYPALLTYRSLGSRNGTIDGVLMLDTNRDGTFGHFQDAWMLCNGTGSLGGELWNVKTTISGESAMVSITPYVGETGTLQVTGDGVLRIYLEIAGSTQEESFPWLHSSHPDICLESREDGLYKVPAGFYSIQDVWVGSVTSTMTGTELWTGTQVLFEMRGQKPFAIAKDETVAKNLGGPITQKMETDPFWSCLGYVFLEPGDFQNSSGTVFQPTNLMAIVYDGSSGNASGYEIRNSAGRVVTKGNFQYG